MQKFQEFAAASSIHGIKYVLFLKSSKTTRIFWLFSIFFSFCGFFYYVHYAYHKLMFDPDTVMKASDRNSNDFPAPAVTVCSNLFAKNNLVNVTYIIQNTWTNSKKNISKSECEYLAANLQWCGPDDSLADMCSTKVLDHINVVKLIEKSSYNKSEMFIDCSTPKCFREVSQVMTDYGICFTRNSLSFNSIFNTKVIHDDFKCYIKFIDNSTHEETASWSAETGYEPHQFIPRRASKGVYFFTFPRLFNKDKNNMCGSSNFRLYLHKPDEVMTPSHLIEYFDLGENMELKINLKSHKTDQALRNFPPNKRKCYFEGEKNLKFYKSYSKALCDLECTANATLKKCGCAKFSYPRENTTSVCNFTSLIQCVLDFNSANCDCYPPCVDVEYSYKLMRSQYKLGPSASNLSFLQVSIESEMVVEIENIVSYKLQNFISDLGGLLGLFMGCSLLSIMEIFYFLANGSSSMFSKCRVHQSPQVWATKTSSKESLNMQQINSDVLSALNILVGCGKQNEKKFREINEKIDGMLKEIQEMKTTIKLK